MKRRRKKKKKENKKTTNRLMAHEQCIRYSGIDINSHPL